MHRPPGPGPGPNGPTPQLESSDGTDIGDLLLVVGLGVVAPYTLERDLRIGRAAECEVHIDHPALSRHHAVLRVGPPRSVQDLGSTNGTRRGDETRRGGEPVVLRVHDSFYIGPFSFVLVSGTRAAMPSLTGREATRVIDPTPGGVTSLVRELAAMATNIIVLGETGVGKEVLAETVHAMSGRRGALVRINCAALGEGLLESEMFGHEKGAFTGATTQRAGLLEAADGGTVFLDEVGELPPGIQAKLLRAIERREVLRIGATRPLAIDVRFIAATNRDLPAEVASGRFRRDLFFRLDGVTLMVPPLRERGHLVGPLALDFLRAARGPAGKVTLDAEVMAALAAYRWPGNVRELRAVIERAVLLAQDEPVGVRHLVFAPLPASATAAAADGEVAPPAASVEDPALFGLDDEQRAERALIIATLDRVAGNQTRAARILGMPRTTLTGKMALYRIRRPRT